MLRINYPVHFFNKKYGTIVISCRREILWVFFKKWITCGILHAKDLLNEEGNLKSLSNCIKNKSNWKCESKISSFCVLGFM